MADDPWLSTQQAMAYIGVKRPETLPVWIDMPPYRRRSRPEAKYRRVRKEKRNGRNFYHRDDLDAYLAFREENNDSNPGPGSHRGT